MDEDSGQVEKTVEMTPFVYPHLIDIGTKHGPDFRFERPALDSDGNCLAMCFRAPVMILTASGEERAEAGDCIVHDPDFPTWHAAIPELPHGFSNDWVYVAAVVMVPLLEELAVPCNVLLPTGNPGLLEEPLRRIRSEMETDDGYSERIIRDALYRMLADIRRSSDEYRKLRDTLTDAERRHYAELARIRERMLAEPEKEYAIRELASKANLSPERFAVLYRKFFLASPLAEILDARLIKARRLLKTTTFQIKEIAGECGWRDEHYFARLFRQKTGTTPGEFRRPRPKSES